MKWLVAILHTLNGNLDRLQEQTEEERTATLQRALESGQERRARWAGIQRDAATVFQLLQGLEDDPGRDGKDTISKGALIKAWGGDFQVFMNGPVDEAAFTLSRALARQVFDLIDADRNGEITRPEWDAYVQNIHEERMEEGDQWLIANLNTIIRNAKIMQALEKGHHTMEELEASWHTHQPLVEQVSRRTHSGPISDLKLS